MKNLEERKKKHVINNPGNHSHGSDVTVLFLFSLTRLQTSLVEGKSLTNSLSNWLMKILYRRASGFTTRSDIGPAREGPSAEVIAYVNVFLLIPPLFCSLFS